MVTTLMPGALVMIWWVASMPFKSGMATSTRLCRVTFPIPEASTSPALEKEADMVVS